MDLNQVLTLVVAGGGTVIALATLWNAVIEYRQQGRQKRAEQFFQIRREFLDNPSVKKVARLFDDPDAEQKLADVEFEDKRDYLGYFEEVALVVNSGLIKPEVAHYMFGYHIVRCWESEAFWVGVNRESAYWSLFRDFAAQMSRVEETFEYRRSDLRF